MKKIRCTDMKVGGIFGLAFYSDRATILNGTVLSMPTVPVNAMTDKDRFVLDVNGEKVEFFRNACPPHYLEAKRPSARGVRNTRVIFYDIGKANAEAPVIETVTIETITLSLPAPKAKRVKARGHEITDLPAVISLHGPDRAESVVAVSSEKPTRADGENFGQFMKRLSAWKKEQAAIAA